MLTVPLAALADLIETPVTFVIYANVLSAVSLIFIVLCIESFMFFIVCAIRNNPVTDYNTIVILVLIYKINNLLLYVFNGVINCINFGRDF